MSAAWIRDSGIDVGQVTHVDSRIQNRNKRDREGEREMSALQQLLTCANQILIAFVFVNLILVVLILVVCVSYVYAGYIHTYIHIYTRTHIYVYVCIYIG
jgi:hypothetical protein